MTFIFFIKMKQPLKKKILKNKKENTINKNNNCNNKITSKNVGSSKLEVYFQNNFLDKLNIKYKKQYHAVDIGRFYDFYIPSHRILIEIDGNYWHSNPKFYNNNNINAIQKRNKKIDEIKNNWANNNNFILLRFWEYDILNNSKKVMDILKKYISDKYIIVF